MNDIPDTDKVFDSTKASAVREIDHLMNSLVKKAVELNVTANIMHNIFSIAAARCLATMIDHENKETNERDRI